MTIDALLEPFSHFGVRLGLEAIQNLLANLGNPHHEVPVIHVAGSNGKGSVCAYLSAVLTEAGYRVGRYTSPHLVDWTERICLNEHPISPEKLEQLIQAVIEIATLQDPLPTQFEIVTAAAWKYFAENQVHVAVMEVGLGGRLDATNVRDRSLVSVITSISREHWQVLGPTLADIAREKAGILKLDCPVVVGHLPPEANVVIYRRAAELGCTITYPQPAKELGDGWAEYRGLEEYEFETDSNDPDEASILHMLTVIRYRLPLQGTIQLHNSALAIATLQILREQSWDISDAAIVSGIARTKWPARLQWFHWRDSQILLDGAHNPASAAVLREFVDNLSKQADAPRHRHPRSTHAPTCWVMGMLSTKDHADVFEALLQPGDSLYLVPVPDHSSVAPEMLGKLAQEVCPELVHCQSYPELLPALEAAIAQEESVVVCGSLYLIGHFLSTVASV